MQLDFARARLAGAAALCHPGCKCCRVQARAGTYTPDVAWLNRIHNMKFQQISLEKIGQTR